VLRLLIILAYEHSENGPHTQTDLAHHTATAAQQQQATAAAAAQQQQAAEAQQQTAINGAMLAALQALISQQAPRHPLVFEPFSIEGRASRAEGDPAFGSGSRFRKTALHR
jgi:hypothetical protein